MTILVTFRQICNFRHPNLEDSTFANRKYEEQAYPQKSEYVRPHSSNSIENAAVPPFPGARLVTILKCRSSDISQP